VARDPDFHLARPSDAPRRSKAQEHRHCIPPTRGLSLGLRRDRDPWICYKNFQSFLLSRRSLKGTLVGHTAQLGTTISHQVDQRFLAGYMELHNRTWCSPVHQHIPISRGGPCRSADSSRSLREVWSLASCVQPSLECYRIEGVHQEQGQGARRSRGACGILERLKVDLTEPRHRTRGQELYHQERMYSKSK
jgi:hypothetical protein